MKARKRLGSSRVFGVLGALVVMLMLLAPTALVAVAKQDEPVGLAEVPTTGSSRPGPMSMTGGPTSAASQATKKGVPPVAIQIDKAAVDAPVEKIDIVDGVMQNPTGPWVVSWYQELPGLGSGSNVVMAGHVDYWDVGPAVFANLGSLAAGDVIRVAGEDNKTYSYKVDYLKTYDLANLTEKTIQTEIVGPTKSESLTLITCGGEFDYAAGEYLSRMVVRATMVKS